MINRFCLSLVFIASILFSVASYACSIPPRNLYVHHSELIKKTETIVLARVVGTVKPSFAKFEVVESLQGNTSTTFTLPNGYVAKNGDNDREEDGIFFDDFNGHRDGIFWDKSITRQWNGPDCIMRPVFYVGRTYLIFLDRPHWRGYEEIRHADDLWIDAVRNQIKDPESPSGLTLPIQDWMRLSHGVFVGRISSCAGPTLTVDEVWHGKFPAKWSYSGNKDDGYWLAGRCAIGQKFFVISYQEEPSPLPYYSASTFRIHGGRVDFGPAIDKSEIQVLGKRVHKLDDLRDLFQDRRP